MGRNNKGNNKKRENYFDQKIKQLGQDFMTKMIPLDLKKDCSRILKDMAYCNIDYSDMTYLNNYLNPSFIQTLMQVCYENWDYNNVTCTGLEYYFNTNKAEDNMLRIYDIHNCARSAYMCMYGALSSILQCIQTCPDRQAIPTTVIDILYMMSNTVIQYNKGMNYTFIVVNNFNSGDRRPRDNDQRTHNKDQNSFRRVPDNGNRR